jgi:hypothetical protein
MNYLTGLASKHDPPDLCLLSSEDYRRETLVLDSSLSFLIVYILTSYKIQKTSMAPVERLPPTPSVACSCAGAAAQPRMCPP